MLQKECLARVEASIASSKLQDWAGFVICSKLWIIKDALKTWFADFEKERTEREKGLIAELEILTQKCANVIFSLEIDIRVAVKGELLEFDRRKEFSSEK